MQKLITIFPVMLLAVILTMSSCKDEEEVVPPPDYFPLKLGNAWVYDVYSVTELGAQYYHAEITKTISRTRMIDGKEFFEVMTSSSIESEPVVEYVRNDSGYYVDEYGDYWIFLGGELNEIVASSVEPYSGGELFTETSLVSRSEQITVSAGSFDCLKYQTKIYTTSPNVTWEARFNDHYFADGVGLVRYNRYYVGFGFYRDYRLKFFNTL